jgi:dTDP-glucose pyrophosphorylase/predicted transcriptional regulator
MHNWKKILLKQGDTLARAIEVLELQALRIVLVVDDDKKILGTITDGDIRRALLQHSGMDTPLVTIMHRDPVVASVNDSREILLSMMKRAGALQIPVIDETGCVVGLETMQQLLTKKSFDNPVFLMAGGFGKRLQPLTNDIPKPLLKIGKKPVLETIMEQFVEAGFHDFYISTHYKAEMIEEYFGSGEKWGVSVKYVNERTPLGTAGALSLLPENLSKLPLLMMNGDLLTKINFEQLLEFHEEQDGVATMCVREYDFQVPYGVVDAKNYRMIGIEEKPVQRFFVNAGIYVLSPETIRSVPREQAVDMPDLLLQQVANNRKVNIFPIHEYWLDIGRIDEFERAQSDFGRVFS